MFNRRERREKGEEKPRKERFLRKRACRFCKDPSIKIDYKDVKAVSFYITDRGRILPRRITSACAYHQRQITNAVKKARILALVPYAGSHMRW